MSPLHVEYMTCARGSYVNIGMWNMLASNLAHGEFMSRDTEPSTIHVNGLHRTTGRTTDDADIRNTHVGTECLYESFHDQAGHFTRDIIDVF